MSLKTRYAFLFLSCLVYIGTCSYATVHLVLTSKYIYALLMVLILYLSSYYLGKKLSHIFFMLAIIRHLKNNGGRASTNNLLNLLKKSRKDKMAEAEQSRHLTHLLTRLKEERVVEFHNGEWIIIEP